MRKLKVDILWFFMLLTLILIIGTLLIGGDILIFLAPRMVPMVWFGLVVLIVLCVYQLLQVVYCLRQKQSYGHARLGILLFLIPVVFMLTVKPDGNTSSMLPNHNVQMINLTNAGADEAAEAVRDEQAAGTGTEEAASSAETEAVSDLLPCVLMEETAVFDPSADVFSEYLHDTLEELIGKTITVYGFVYEDETFPEDTVLVSRMMITCCAADASIVGFHVKIADSTELIKNEWIRVTGTVRSIEMPYYGETFDFPILTNGLVVRCNEPVVEDVYIYP